MDTGKRRALFLIFKEALHNALKYSGCSTVEVALEENDKQLTLRISDNGQGFDLSAVQSYNGNGLASMATRAQEVGGRATVSSSPGHGTVVLAWVPMGKSIPRKGD